MRFEAASREPENPIALALRLLLTIAEDPLMRPSYRAAARRHVRDVENAVKRQGLLRLGAEAAAQPRSAPPP